MARSVHKYEITLNGKEKQERRQAKHKGCQPVRLVIRILIISLAAQGLWCMNLYFWVRARSP